MVTIDNVKVARPVVANALTVQLVIPVIQDIIRVVTAVRSAQQGVVLVPLLLRAAPALRDITRTHKELAHNYRLIARRMMLKMINAQLVKAVMC